MRSEFGIVPYGIAWDADRQPRLAGEAQHPDTRSPTSAPRRQRRRAPARGAATPPQPTLSALAGVTAPRPHPARRRALLLSSCVVLGAALWNPAARARDISTSVSTQILNDGETLNILNAGTVTGTPAAGVRGDLSANGTNTVTNAGTVRAGAVPANQFFRGIELNSGLVVNQGSINAGNYRDPSGHPGLASAGVWFGSAGTVRNAGTIEGGTAIVFVGDGAVTGTLNASGEVTAVRGLIHALGASSGSGIFIGDWRDGRAQGKLLQDLDIAADAQIIGRAGGLGIAVGDLNNRTITNSGSIRGVGRSVGTPAVWYDGTAIRIGQGSGRIVNNLGGWINSGDGWLGSGYSDSTLDHAISVANFNNDQNQTITVDNAGTIRGGQGILIPSNGALINGQTIVNGQTIRGRIESTRGDAVFIGRLVGSLDNSGDIRAVNPAFPEQQFAGAVRIGNLNDQTIRNAGSIFAAGRPSATNNDPTGSFTLARVQRTSISGIHIAAGSGMVVNDSTGHITDGLYLPDGGGGNYLATMTAGIHVVPSGTAAAQVTVQNAGTIIAFNTAILFEGDGGHVTGVGGGGITGQIKGDNGIFVGDWRGWNNRAQGKLLANLTIAATGRVEAGDGGALRIGDLNGRTIINNGLIYAAATSFSSDFNGGVVIGQGSGTIINTRVIESHPPVNCVPGIGCPLAAGGDGIDVVNFDGSTSQRVTVMNSGRISGRITGVRFRGSGAVTGIVDAITNPDGLLTGTIASGGTGISVTNELLLDLRIGATGTISGNTWAIDVGSLVGRTIENAGSVIGGTRVSRADEGARIDNRATGSMDEITLGHAGVASPLIPTVTNAGTINAITANTRVYVENSRSIRWVANAKPFAITMSPERGGAIVNQAGGVIRSVPRIAGTNRFRHFVDGIAISAGGRITAPPVVAGTQDATVDNWGTIDGKVTFARGNDTYIHRATAAQNGLVVNVRTGNLGTINNALNGGTNSSVRRVDGGGGTNTYIYEVPTRAVFNSNDLIRFQNLHKTGAGTLVFDPAEFRAIDRSIPNIFTIPWIDEYEEAIDGFTGMALGTERIEIQGGTFENRGTIAAQTPVSSFHTELYDANGIFAPENRTQADVTLLLEGDQTVFVNAAGAVMHAPVTAGVGDLRQTVSNFGTIAATVALGDGPDSYILWQTGTQDGVADGGGGGTDPATRNTLRIETAPAGRTLAAGTFVNFQTINLNQQADSTGTLTLGAATSPATAASLDTGGIAGTTATLHRGGLALVDANSSLRARTVTLEAGTTLSGNGTIFNGAGSNIGASGGTTTAAGIIAPGNSAGHLTFDGNLTLTPDTLLDFEFGAVDVVGGPLNDLITVTGDLVLDGAIRVTETTGGNFTGPGVHRIINYGGALDDRTLDIQGPLPNGLVGSIQTTVANQVNLVILGGGATTQYWDGPNTTANDVVDGGTEFWRAATTNWTTATGTPNAAWSGGLAVFQAAPGVPSPRVVTVETGYTPNFQGLQFSVDGYLIQNSALRPDTGAFIAVSGAFDAQIDSVIEGNGSLNKQGIGRLILTGDNSYSGGTTITAGTLAVGHDRALGTGAVTLGNGTTLQAFADGLVLANAMTLSGATGAIDTQGFDLRIDSLIDGGGTLNKQGTGRLILTGANSYGGGTTITAGTLAVGHDSALGTGAVTLRDGTTLQAFGADRTLENAIRLAGITGTLDTQAFRLTLTGDLSVRDTLRKLGSGALVLEAAQPALPEIILSTVNLVQGTLENARRLALSQGVAMGPGTTLDNRPGAQITTGAGSAIGAILGDAGAQTVINAGTIVAAVSLGAGDDRYMLHNSGLQTGRVDGGAGTDTAAFEVSTGSTRVIEGSQFVNFETLEKSGGGTLQLTPGTLQAARVVILDGRVENMTSVNVTDQVNLGASNITWANMAGSSVTATAADPVAIRATAAQVTVENAGAISGEVRLTGGSNTYVLTTTGTQTGLVHAGDAAANNRLHLNASTTGRTVAPASFVHFDRIDLNLIDAADPSTSRGRITLAGRGSEVATLDAGATGQVMLHHGELNLQHSTSTVRAGVTEIGAPARVSGNGEVVGALTVRGTIAPGNSIGTLTVTTNYTQTGPYEVEFRPPPVGRASGRHTLAGGGAASLDEQDADLISVTGTATLTGGTIVPVRLGTAAQMNAALAASPTGQLRWLVLRAQGSLGGTRYVALSNVAEVRVEYPANGTDVELVLTSPVTDPPPGIVGRPPGGGEPPPIIIPDTPPPVLPPRDGTLRQWGLSQNGVLFDLAADCDRPIGLSAAARDESWCSFGQGRLLTASGEGSDGLSVYGGAWSQSGLGQSRLRVADAATGVMRRVGDEAWLGMAVGYGLGWFDFGGAGGDAFRTSFNALQLAGLGRWARGPLELRGMLGYGWSEVESRRPSGLRGGDPRLVADYDLQQATVAGEARWWFGTRGDLALAPTLRLTGARQWRGGYSEEGTSADRFTAERATWDSLRMALGVTGEIGASLYGTPLVVEPRLGWVRELGDRAVTVTGTYAGAPGVVMSGTGGPAPRDSAVAGLAGIAQLTDSTRIRLGYDGSWYEAGSSHSLTMRLSYAW